MRIRFPFPFRKKALPASEAPRGWRIYAIGDVHGCLRQLDRLLEAIEADLEGREVRGHLLFLGDLIDRGPDSAAVIERLSNGRLPGEKATFLMGNHEEVLLKCHDGNADMIGAWLKYGGLQTLESYGLARSGLFERAGDLAGAIRELIPREHIEFIRSFRDQVQLGDYLFVHAGIRPGVQLDEQDPKDLRWIRRGFLDNSSDHGAIVVHGHTIVSDIEVHRNRIAVDTGCYTSGKLAALVLEGAGKGKLIVENLPQAVTEDWPMDLDSVASPAPDLRQLGSAPS